MSDMQIEHTQDGECINLHSDRDISVMANNNEDITIVKDRTITIMQGNMTVKISQGNLDHDVVAGTSKHHVKGSVTEIYEDTQSTAVTNAISIVSNTASIFIQGQTSIQLHVGGSMLWMDDKGNIALVGKTVKISGSEKVEITGDQIVSAAQTNHEISGAAVKSEATGNNVVKGAMVMLNP